MAGMTPDDFRVLALALEGAEERAHMNHPDFRVGGKIFATLAYPDAGSAMVKLTPEEQFNFVREYPAAFVPVKGAWGKQGCTNVRLAAAAAGPVGEALRAAWETARRAKPARKRARG
jgi:hypothetical protein